MKHSLITLVICVACVFGMLSLIDRLQKDNSWSHVVSEQVYENNLSDELLQDASEIFDQSPISHWRGRVIAKQTMNLQDGGNMTILAVEAYQQVIPCLQLDFEFAIGDSVQMLSISHRQPGTQDDFNQTYFAIPLK